MELGEITCCENRWTRCETTGFDGIFETSRAGGGLGRILSLSLLNTVVCSSFKI